MNFGNAPRSLLSSFKGHYFLIILLLTAWNKSTAQSYHYFNASMPVLNSDTVNYFIFFGLETDGTAFARVRYIDASSGEQKLVEQKYKDVNTNSFTDSLVQNRYLTAENENLILEGLEDSNYIQTRIKLVKENINGDSFFTPKEIEFLEDNVWRKAVLNENETYTFTDLLDKKDFLRFFYQEDDPFLQYLVVSNSKGLNSEELKSKMYLVIVANTLDATIGKSSKKDLDKVSAMFTRLAGKMGIPFSSKTISGDDFNLRNVKRTLNRLDPQKDDILVFYYSGHGFRFEDDQSKFPRMSLRTSSANQPLVRNNLSVEEAQKLLLKKNAKVTIVISDCCNEEINAPIPTGIDPIRPRANADLKLNVANCRTMFLPDRPISIIVGSAEEGQRAVGNPELGGFFTNFFLSELNKSMYTNTGTSSWLKLLIDAREKTRWQALSGLCKGVRCVQRAELSVVPPL